MCPQLYGFTFHIPCLLQKDNKLYVNIPEFTCASVIRLRSVKTLTGVLEARRTRPRPPHGSRWTEPCRGKATPSHHISRVLVSRHVVPCHDVLRHSPRLSCRVMSRRVMPGHLIESVMPRSIDRCFHPTQQNIVSVFRTETN